MKSIQELEEVATESYRKYIDEVGQPPKVVTINWHTYNTLVLHFSINMTNVIPRYRGIKLRVDPFCPEDTIYWGEV